MFSKTAHFIVPAYKASQTIKTCLESIVNQSYPGHLIRVSVVENGPKDGIESTVSQYPSCTYHYNEKAGRSEARNLLLNTVTADFVAYIDVDVILDKTWLEECMRCMTSPYCAGVAGPVFKIGEAWLDQFRRKVSEFTTNGLSNILENPTMLGCLNTAAVLFRTSALKGINGFDTSFSRSEDYELTHRLLRSGYILKTTDKAKAEVQWDRGLFEYFIVRFFQMGTYAPKAHLRHGLPPLPFKDHFRLKAWSRMTKLRDIRNILGWISINVSFSLGHEIGRIKHAQTPEWTPKIIPKRVLVNQKGIAALYEINPKWEIIIVRNEVRLYCRKILKFIYPSVGIQKMIIHMLDSSMLDILDDEREQLLQELISNQFLQKMRHI